MSPKGIRLKRNLPKGVVKTVLSKSSELIGPDKSPLANQVLRGIAIHQLDQSGAYKMDRGL